VRATPSAVIPPGQPAAGNVANYLVPAILVTVLCCLFTGIPAIVYAAQVNGKLATGDIAGAQVASKNAKMWCWISVGAGLLIGVFWVLAVVLGIMSRH
jgi:predicted secreted protein